MAFRRWLYCPECESDETGLLAYRIMIVLECYECGLVEEFEFGKDVPVHQLAADDIAERADNG